MRAPKFYRYWFYRSYRFSKKAWEEEPEHAAMVGSAMTMTSQGAGLLFIVSTLIDPELNKQIFTGRNVLEILSFAGIFLFISYFTMYKDEKWKEIVNEFKNESAKQENLGDYFLVLYLLASMIGIFPLVFWLHDIIVACKGGI